MKTLLIGAHGFLGRQVWRHLDLVEGLTITPATRRPQGGTTVLDLREPSTWGALDGFPLVINCADSIAADPQRAARYVVERGGIWIETTSDTIAIERLLALREEIEGPGLLLLGAGIFTGVSNLVAGDAVARLRAAGDEPARVDLGLRFSPLSGAGRGMVELMMSMFTSQVRRWRGGERILVDPYQEEHTQPFGTIPRAGLLAPFAEAPMLAASTGSPEVATWLTPVPGVMSRAIRALPLALFQQAWFRAITRFSLRVLRTVLLAWRSSAVELAAEVHGQRGGLARSWVWVNDGMGAAGAAVASIAEQLTREQIPGHQERPTGVRMVDEVLKLDPVTARIRQLGGDALRLTSFRALRDPTEPEPEGG